MASPSFGEVLHSKQVTFLIGPEETPIIVHAGAIARLSAPLDRLVNGKMLEAQENVACFKDLEVQDFERICEFSYRGTYTLPKSERFSDAEVDAATQMFHLADPISPYFMPYFGAHNCEDDSSGKESEGDHEESTPTTANTSVFCDSLSPIASFWSFTNPNQDARLEWPVVSFENTSWRENFAPVFLAHARLYAFAEQYLAPALKMRALQNVRNTLAGYTLFVSGLEAVVQLARFAYERDYIPDREGRSVDPLRQLIVAYVVAHHKHFRNYSGHRQLLEGWNEYATDVLDYIAIWFDPDTIHERGRTRPSHS
ncbi:hypothetical protein P171DRAFT_475817 [Karstenula rhodostoma CBS 690.94]|uniref:BTB domain-containing protein n=1 Tax=Karstenula rhodostoma CBS 690.94 TaxID=1392251 RepID=A0A9P4PAB8_9PLEO|nr:hypothetical protein P171DRAFT_475817 [Karstenula rhodostoma CBS 690.94]